MGSLQNTDIDLVIFVRETNNQFLRSRQARGEKDAFAAATAIARHELTSIRSGHRPGKSDRAMIDIVSAIWALGDLSAAVDSAIIAGTRSALNVALSAS
jgi:hypothetical protein